VSNSLKAKLWIVVRFLVFGVGGFLLMLAAWLSFLDHLNTHSKWLLVFAPMAIVGAVLMLYGVGEWGKWAYLGVFLSIPLSMLLWFVPSYPQDKLSGAFTPAIVAIRRISVRETLLLAQTISFVGTIAVVNLPLIQDPKPFQAAKGAVGILQPPGMIHLHGLLFAGTWGPVDL
jgi:hypothetical protein